MFCLRRRRPLQMEVGTSSAPLCVRQMPAGGHPHPIALPAVLPPTPSCSVGSERRRTPLRTPIDSPHAARCGCLDRDSTGRTSRSRLAADSEGSGPDELAGAEALEAVAGDLEHMPPTHRLRGAARGHLRLLWWKHRLLRGVSGGSGGGLQERGMTPDCRGRRGHPLGEGETAADVGEWRCWGISGGWI